MVDSNVRRWQPDRSLFLLVVTLVAIGLAMVFSSSTVLTLDKDQNAFHFIMKQGIATLAGIAALLFLMRFDYKHLSQPRVYLIMLGISMVLLVLVLFAPAINNTNRWFRIFGFSFQPSEFAKISLVITLAAVSSRWKGMLSSWGFIFLSLAVLVAPVIFLIAIEPDLGTAVVLTVASFSIIFCAGIGMRKILFLTVVAALIIAVFIYVSPYRMERVMTFFNPAEDKLGSGWQAHQSEIALGSGGVLGLGFMQGKQKLFFLPAAHTDFIFSVIGEEWGIIGTTVILLLFLGLFARGLRVAFSSRDLFGFLLAVGFTTLIVGQALVNMSVAATLLPTKGIPLPLISYGGTSIFFSLVALGILLNVSQYCRKVE